MNRAVCVLAALLSVALPAALASPQELVLHKEGTKEYHRPGCDVVRDGKDVLAMSRGQAEGRGLKAHTECDPARMSPSAATSSSARAPSVPVFVFVDSAAKSARGESNQLYHRENCTRLGKERRKLSVDDAGKQYWPCPKCRPPIRKRK